MSQRRSDTLTATEVQTQLAACVDSLSARIRNLEERITAWTVKHETKEHANVRHLADNVAAMEDHLYTLDAKIRRLE